MNRRIRGVSLIESLTAAVCLSLVAAAIGSSIGFSSQRTAYDLQKAIVIAELESRHEQLTAVADMGSVPTTSSTETITLPRVPGGVTIQTVCTPTAIPDYYSVVTTGTWETNKSHTITFQENIVVSEVTSLNVSVTGTFGKATNATDPTVIDLQARGIMPGETIRLTTQDYYRSPYTSGSSTYMRSYYGVTGAFSTSSTLDPNLDSVDRVPGIIEPVEEPGFITGDAWDITGHFPNESFQVSSNTSGYLTNVIVTVPPNCRYLFLAPADTGDFTENEIYPYYPLQIMITRVTANDYDFGLVAWNKLAHVFAGQGGWVHGVYPGNNSQSVTDTDWVPLKESYFPYLQDDHLTIDGKAIDGSSNDSAYNAYAGFQLLHPTGGGSRTPGSPYVVCQRWMSGHDLTNVYVYGSVTKKEAGGDGVNFALVHSSGAVLWSDQFDSSASLYSQKQFSVPLTSLNEGDWVELRVGGGANDDNDLIGIDWKVSGAW